jgi:site-specific DNA recombinase
MLQNRIYRGEIVHNGQCHLGEHEPIIDQPLWDAVQAQLAGNAAQRNDGGKTRQPSRLAGMLFDGDGNRMTPSHAVKKGTRYRYYVSLSYLSYLMDGAESRFDEHPRTPVPHRFYQNAFSFIAE